MTEKLKVGVLTGGGDCPGLNAVIRAIVVRGIRAHGFEMAGIRNGWDGLLNRDCIELGRDEVSGILPRGGTILGTSRVDPVANEKTTAAAVLSFNQMGLHAIVAIGGDGTLRAAGELCERGLKIVGAPKTIDNDVGGTDYTFGFDTAVEIATEAIDRLHTTAEAHHRIIVVEVMGRNAGWIATYAGIAGGADMILVPEHPFDFDDIVSAIKDRHARGKKFSIIVIAEGAYPKGRKDEYLRGDKVDEYGNIRLGGCSNAFARELEERSGVNVRTSILGYTQRGGKPTAWDRVLATRFGVKAADMVAEGKWGHLAALRGFDVVAVPLKECVSVQKQLPEELYLVAKNFFG